MMKKRSLAMIVLFFMIVSSAGTAAVILLGGLSAGGLVMIQKSEYEDYKDVKAEYAGIEELKDYINKNYYVPVDEKDLDQGLYKGLFMGIGDPYSEYLTKEEFEDIVASTSGEFQGIGVTIAPDEQGFINVIAPIEDTPAERAGIKSGDKIVKVDDTEYSSTTIDEAVDALRGAPGTKVRVYVIRKGELLSFELTRSNIVLKSVKSEMLDGNIGYIRITNFDEKTADEFNAHLRSIEAKDPKGLIVDLRDNPGGVVDASVAIADKLLGAGVITYTEDRAGNKEYYKSDEQKIDIPFALLINVGSASASEILAGAVKDYKAGRIIGETSFGKGIIQRIEPYGDDGAGIKLTVMQYFSPNGNVIHKKGVEPDIKVEISEEDNVDGELPRENDRQLLKAIEVLSE